MEDGRNGFYLVEKQVVPFPNIYIPRLKNGIKQLLRIYFNVPHCFLREGHEGRKDTHVIPL